MLRLSEFLNFTGKNILITGAASGIGRATAELFSELGAKLILVDINEEELLKTANKCTNAIILVIDLSDLNSLKSAVEAKIKESEPLDALVHVAGIPYMSPLKSLNINTAEKVLKINTLAALELSKIFTKHKNFKGDYPSLTFISSVYGLVGSAANVGYAMSKAALHGITKSLAIELAPKNIRVNCIAPGFLKTEMLEGVSQSFDDEYSERLAAMHPLGLGTANDVAGSIAYLTSGMAKWITGSIISVDGGFTAQ